MNSNELLKKKISYLTAKQRLHENDKAYLSKATPRYAQSCCAWLSAPQSYFKALLQSKRADADIMPIMHYKRITAIKL